MWYKVLMEADGRDEAVVYLSDSEYEAVKSFLNQVKAQRTRFIWEGGYWGIGKGYPTEREAWSDNSVSTE